MIRKMKLLSIPARYAELLSIQVPVNRCVVAISPQTDIVIDSNVGGYFGPFLKFSGFDSLELQGKASKDVLICIEEATETVSIYECPELPQDSHKLAEELTDIFAESDTDKKNVSVVSAGTAGRPFINRYAEFQFLRQ